MEILKEPNYIYTIIIPISYLIFYIVYFIKRYLNNKVLKIFNFIIISLSIILTPIFYLNGFGEIFSITWPIVLIGILFITLTVFKQVEKLIEKDSFSTITHEEKYIYLLDLIIGICFLVIPHTYLFNIIGGGINHKVDLISKIIISIAGLTTIIINKYIFYLLYKFKKK